MIQIRPATPEDLPALPAIESSAGELFDQIPALADVPPDLTPVEEFEEAQRKGLLWIAEAAPGVPVGFALVEWLDGLVHLEELDVLPAHGRHGIGTRLVRTVLEARTQGLAAVTLSTFRDIPWNAPFYQSLGFRILEPEELTAGLAAKTREEAAKGLPPELRVVMRCEVG